MGYLYIFGTVIFTVYGQLVLKWQVTRQGVFPAEIMPRLGYILKLLGNPWVWSSLTAGFLAFLAWIVALSEFELSYAYPFMSLSFVFVLLLSGIFFHESITVSKTLGVALIIAGIVVGSRG